MAESTMTNPEKSSADFTPGIDRRLGWLVLRQPTYSQMLHAWNAGVDSSGIFFYFVARPWLRVFGASAMALRLCSATALAAGFAVTWITARRFYSFGTVLLGIFPFYLLSRGMDWQMSDARCYGLWIFATAFTAYMFVRTAPGKKIGPGALLLTFLAHALLVGSHMLGILYSGGFVVGLLAQDVVARKFRPALYLSAMSGWFIVIVSMRNFAIIASNGRPSFWTLRPAFRDIFFILTAYESFLYTILGLAAVAFIAAYLARARAGLRDQFFLSSRYSIYFIVFSLFFTAFAIFIKSKLGISICVDRYLLPVLIGDVFLLCEFLDRLSAMIFNEKWALRCGTVALLLFCATWVHGLKDELPLPEKDFTQALLERIPQGMPLVILDSGIFSQMALYQNEHARILTLVDWPILLDPNFGPGGVSGGHEMDNWRKIGFYSSQIQTTTQILTENPAFIVMTNDLHPLWLQKRVMSNPLYKVTALPDFVKNRDTERLWLVRTR